MKKQKNTSAFGRLKTLLLVAAFIGFTQVAASAAAGKVEVGQDDILRQVQTPATLGGVALALLTPLEPKAPRSIAVNMPIGEDAQRASAATGGGLDAIQTAAITSPSVFGSVALSMRNLPAASRWAPVYRAIVDCSASAGCGRRNYFFSNIIDAAKRKDFAERLSFVNSSINRLIAYKKDSAVYGSLDHWAKPSETLDRRAGDCEDFAILKMATLLSSGIPANNMALVILQDRKRGFFHAVLAVNTPAGAFILDNLSNTVAKDSELPDYQPLYSVSTDRAWIHGAKAGTALLAEVKGGLASISPGEGI